MGLYSLDEVGGNAIARDDVGQHNVPGRPNIPKHRFSTDQLEEQGVSEEFEEERSQLRVGVQAAQNCSVSRPQCQLCPAILLKSGQFDAIGSEKEDSNL